MIIKTVSRDRSTIVLERLQDLGDKADVAIALRNVR